LVVSGAGLSTSSIRPVLGLQTTTNVTFDIWVRPLDAGNTGAPTGNAFVTIENAAGTRAAAFRIGPSLSIDYGTAIAGVWQATGILANPNTWYRITMKLDYATRTYDFIVDGVKVNASPIPFYVNGSESLRQIRVFRGTNQAGYILDDLSVTATPQAPRLGIRKDGASVVIFWPASVTGFALEGTTGLTSPSWNTVPHTTVGDENQAVVDPTGPSMFYRLTEQANP
jgi:hypothetical protein